MSEFVQSSLRNYRTTFLGAGKALIGLGTFLVYALDDDPSTVADVALVTVPLYLLFSVLQAAQTRDAT